MKLSWRFALAALAVSLSACTVRVDGGPRGGVPDAVANARLAKAKFGEHRVRVGNFGASVRAVSCDWERVVAPAEGEAFSDYVKNATRDVFASAGLHDEEAPVTLRGSVEAMDLRDGPGPKEGRWTLRLMLVSSNGRRLTVEHSRPHPLHVSWWMDAYDPCASARDALPMAVEGLLSDVLAHPEFPALLEPPTTLSSR